MTSRPAGARKRKTGQSAAKKQNPWKEVLEAEMEKIRELIAKAPTQEISVTGDDYPIMASVINLREMQRRYTKWDKTGLFKIPNVRFESLPSADTIQELCVIAPATSTTPSSPGSAGPQGPSPKAEEGQEGSSSQTSVFGEPRSAL